MRKRLFCLFITIIIMCTGCVQLSAEVMRENVPAQEDVPLLENYVSELEVAEAPVREYGESTTYILMEDDLVVRILYPVGEIAELEENIENWIEETAAYYKTEAKGSKEDGEAAELNVEYSSYVVDDKYVGVKMTGIFQRPYMAHPVDITATFNAGLESKKALALDDILQQGGKEKFQSMVVSREGIEEEFADDGVLKNWLLTPDGLEITLTRGEYLPMSEGTKTFLYSYEELKDVLVMPEESGTKNVSLENTENIFEPSEEASEEIDLDEDKPMIALTFDDGPSAQTERLLDAFKANGGKGTFFVIGNMIDGRENTLKRMAEEGHEIGSHSWNHRQLTKLSGEEITDQIMTTRAKIYDATGVDTVLLRPPYGSYNDAVKAKAEELEVVMVNWCVDTLDWKYKNADRVYNSVMEQAEDGAIILCHDLYSTTVDAMERAIPDLVEQGYQLVTVTELLTSDEGIMEAGKVYRKR